MFSWMTMALLVLMAMQVSGTEVTTEWEPAHPFETPLTAPKRGLLAACSGCDAGMVGRMKCGPNDILLT
jgi:hypothetical protein